jgi:phage tail protein X
LHVIRPLPRGEPDERAQEVFSVIGALIYGLTALVLTTSLIGMAHGLAHAGPLFSEATVIVSVIGLVATALLRKAGKSEIE